MSNLQIVVPPGGGLRVLVPVIGVKALVGGIEMEGVYQIDVYEELNGFCKAVIHCQIDPLTDIVSTDKE